MKRNKKRNAWEWADLEGSEFCFLASANGYQLTQITTADYCSRFFKVFSYATREEKYFNSYSEAMTYFNEITKR